MNQDPNDFLPLDEPESGWLWLDILTYILIIAFGLYVTGHIILAITR